MKMDNVRAFQRELEEMGVSPKSVEQRIAEAVAAERERCAVLLDHLAESSEKLAERASQLDDPIAHDMSLKARALRSAAGRIRAGPGEGEQG